MIRLEAMFNMQVGKLPDSQYKQVIIIGRN